MFSTLRQNNDSAIGLLRGLIDAFEYPACVTSPTMGLVLWNKAARELKKYGCNLSCHNFHDGEIIECRDKTYQVVGKAINHSTDFVLYELRDITTPLKRMQQSCRMLDSVLREDDS